jgi:hypothetical protein
MLRASFVLLSFTIVLQAGCTGAWTPQSSPSDPVVEDAPPEPSDADAGAESPACPPSPDGHASLGSSFDDRQTTLATGADVVARRQALINTIWPCGSLPSSLPVVTQQTVAAVGGAIPANLTNLAPSVLQFDFPTMNPMPPNGTDGGNGMAFLLTPVEAPRHRVVILNTGHVQTFDESEDGTGMRNVVQTLLTENYSVLLMYMPHFTPSDATGTNDGPGNHDLMFSDGVDAGTGSTYEPTDATNYRYFFEPSVIAINFLASDAAPGGAFTDIALAGLSGGAWTTVMMAALDTRPRLSIAVAAGVPEYVEADTTMDAEQFVRGRLGIGYADLHVMGADGTALGGAPRRQTHVLNRRDSCCFGEIEYDSRGGDAGTWQSSMRLFESNVRGALQGMGSAGRYRLEIDEMADHHMVSANSLQNILLAELDDDRKLVGAADSNGDMFYRGVNGNLWRRTFPVGGGSTETDTGVAIAGVANVAEHGPNTVDVFARDSASGGGGVNVIHYFLPQGQTAWSRETLPMFSMSDPGVVSSDGSFDLVALAPDGSLHRYSSTTSAFDLVSANVFLGPPAAVRFQGALHVFARGKDLSMYHFWKTDPAAGTAATPAADPGWAMQPLPVVFSGFPTAAVCGNAICVAALGTDSTVRMGTIDASNAWSGWSGLSATVSFKGTPSIGAVLPPPTMPGGAAMPSGGGPPSGPLYVTTDHGTLGRFIRAMPAGTWTFTDLANATVASPTAIQATGGAVISGGQSGALWVHRGTTATLGGWFD